MKSHRNARELAKQAKSLRRAQRCVPPEIILESPRLRRTCPADRDVTDRNQCNSNRQPRDHRLVG